MLEYNEQYETHPLYGHFKNWVDMDDNYQESYFIINTALYAAEEYIFNKYSILTRATPIHEFLGNITTGVVYPRYSLTNLLSIYTADGYELPSVSYFDAPEGKYIVSDGVLQVSEGSLLNVTATDLNVDYITGYLMPPNAKDTSVVPTGNDDLGAKVTRPSISNPDGSPLHSPLSTSNTYYDLYVIGDPGSVVYVNDIEADLLDAAGNAILDDVNPAPIINEERIGKISLTLVDGINTFSIDARDESSNISQPLTIVINKQSNFNQTSVELISKDLVTNDGEYNVSIKSTPGSKITVNDVDLLIYSTGYDTVTGTIVTEGVNLITIKVTAPSGNVTQSMVQQVLYDSSISEAQVAAINDTASNTLSMPQDMLMAILMIAHHYFRIALYKHDETNSYGDSVSNRITFNKDRFPKDAHNILTRYMRY